MWRVFVCVLAAACGRATPAAPEYSLALLLDDPIKVSSDRHWVAVSFAPSIALGTHDLLVTWGADLMIPDDDNRVLILARRLSLGGVPHGDEQVLDVQGWAPSATASPDGYVVAWRLTQQKVLFGAVSGSVAHVAPVLVNGATGTPSFADAADEITAVACSHDYKRVFVIRDPIRDLEVERLATREGCNNAFLVGGDKLLGINAHDSDRTELVELQRPSSRSLALLDATCTDAVVIDGETIFVCIDFPAATGLHFRRKGSGVFDRSTRINVTSADGFSELHAVALDQGVLLAWTASVSDEDRLTVALVGKDGRLRTKPLDVSTGTAVPLYNLVGRGSDAWLTFVNRRHPQEDFHVDVVRIRVTETSARSVEHLATRH